MNEHVPPVFAAILSGIAGQPAQVAQLQRRADKAAPRRFTGASITDFGDLDAGQQVATLVRSMPEPTPAELQIMLGAISTRVGDMEARYSGMAVVAERLDAAYGALDGVRSANAPDEGELQDDMRRDMARRSW